jgi:hypothetical protein
MMGRFGKKAVGHLELKRPLASIHYQCSVMMLTKEQIIGKTAD